jgi:putative transposase
VRCACLHRHRGAFPLGLMCRVLGIPRSSYYAWRVRGPSQRGQANAALRVRIRALYAESDQTYGSPRMHRELVSAGLPCGRHRIARLMRADGLWAVSRRRWRTTPRRAPRGAPAPDRLQRAFGVQGPNQVWATDLTYVPTRTGWLYLALVLDVGTRRVVGWAMAQHLRETLPLAALTRALGRRAIGPGLIHHSDQGRQYTSTRYQALLAAHQILPSMSRVGECWDNAVAESFFATLKCERLHRRDYRTPAEAQHDIVRYIEGWYNPRRRHSTLGYLSPMEYEQQWAA